MKNWPKQRLLMEVFSDEALLFDRLSGDTHYMNAVAYARLMGLSELELRRTYAVSMQDDEWTKQVQQIDMQLKAWGLVK